MVQIWPLQAFKVFSNERELDICNDRSALDDSHPVKATLTTG